MNYMITRTIIMLILILGFIIYLKICKKIISKKNINPMFIKKVNLKVVIFLYLIIWVILNIIPFENYFIKFKTVEDNINYFFTNPKIVKKFVYDDYAYVNVLHGEVTDYFMYLEKKNGSWEFSSLFPRNHGYHKSIKSIDFQLIELKNKNSIGIKITTKR